MGGSMTLRTNTILSAEDVSLTLGGHQILRAVNFHIDDLVRTNTTDITGQVVSILGRSGCGKTSLLRVIAGLETRNTGTVRIGLGRTPIHCGDVGLVSQQYELFRHRTVLGNLKLVAGRDRAMELLNDFGLADKANSFPAELSGGQRQRVAIAQQILSAGDLLLMDEPTAGLDPLSKKQICGMIGRVAARNEQSTICISTHDIPTAVQVSDTIILLGREYDENRQPIPGTTVIDTYDLVALGICWAPGPVGDITHSTLFHETVAGIQNRFDTL